MSDQPMREMSLIELITSLPKTHIARKEYTKSLGRLMSKEKDERLQLEQENARLEDSYQSISLKCADLNSELSALRNDYSDAESLLAQLEQEVKELKAHSQRLSQAINSKLYDFTPRHAVIQELLELANPLGSPSISLAQHDKETRKEFLDFIKQSENLTGIEKVTIHALWVKFEQLQEQE